MELDAKTGAPAPGHPLQRPTSIPSPFELAPLNSVSLAEFTYCEADPVRLGHVRSINNDSARLVDMIKTSLGGAVAVNHVGKLYDAVVETLGEVEEAGKVKIDFDDLHFRDLGDMDTERKFNNLQGSPFPL